MTDDRVLRHQRRVSPVALAALAPAHHPAGALPVAEGEIAPVHTCFWSTRLTAAAAARAGA